MAIGKRATSGEGLMPFDQGFPWARVSFESSISLGTTISPTTFPSSTIITLVGGVEGRFGASVGIAISFHFGRCSSSGGPEPGFGAVFLAYAILLPLVTSGVTSGL